MNVFLTHSYFYQLDEKQWKNKTPYPPLATITALALLNEKEIHTEFYDVSLDPSPQLVKSKIATSSCDVVVIYDDGFNFLTKMCLTNMRYACFEIIIEAKKKGAKVIVSSSDATDHFELYHSKGADIVLHGEGELALYECLNNIELNIEQEGVSGISYLLKNEIIKTGARINLKELDAIPNASWSAVDINSYKKIWKRSKFPFTLNVSTTRGCPFKCNWCAKPLYGNRYNSRSPERVVEELQFLQKEYQCDNFWITDDIFGLKPGWVEVFNKLVKAENLNIRYKIQSRADLLLKDETIENLVSSGLEEVWVGAESGSQKILDAMDKGTTIEQIYLSTKLLQKKGAKVAYFLQFGYLGESKEDIQMTIDMVRNNKPDDIGISVSYPLPGTPFYNRVKEQLGEKANWEDSNDLDLMFKSTYSSAYYKSLQRYVHHLFRYQQGIRKIKNPSTKISWRYLILLPYNLIMMIEYKIMRK